jgi:hypothetical protein
MRLGSGFAKTPFELWLRGGLRADHALGVLSEYPFFLGVAAGGSALTAGHFCRRPKVTKTLGPGVRPLAGARGSFAPGSIRAQRLRFASLHLLPLCLAAPNGRCAPTPGSIPPLSLPMGPARQDQKRYSSLRSLCRSCRGLRSFDLDFAFLWERACSRRRSDSQFISTRQFTLPSYSFFRNLRS